jgi:hypothetical protein
VKTMLSVVLGLGLVASSTGPALADSAAQDVAYGTGSVFTTLVYAPVKASFCILGGITSGFTLPFAGPQTAERVATRACGGTWAITPDTLKGREPVRFVGGNGSADTRQAVKR